MFQDLRVKAGLSQKQVAEAFGDKSAQFVSNCERSVAPWPVKRIPKMAKLYGVPVKFMFDEFMKAKRELYWKEMKSK